MSQPISHSGNARVGRHGNLVVCTPAKPKPVFKDQRPEPRQILRVGTDGLYRVFSPKGKMIFVGTLADLLHLSTGGSCLYFAR